MNRPTYTSAAIAATLLVISCGASPAAPSSGNSQTGAPIVPAPVSMSTFTFSIDPACRAQFPEFLQQRSYPAVADGSYSNVIRLTGNFVNSAGLDWNIVYRSTHDGSTTLGFHDPPLWELLDPRSYFLIYGSSDYRSTSEYGEWAFWGRVTFCAERQQSSDPACAVPETTCSSTRHRLRVSPN